MAQMVKNLSKMQEIWVQPLGIDRGPPHRTPQHNPGSLGQEGPLEEGMATHSSVFTWEIPWREMPGGLQSMGLQRDGYD